MYTILYLFYYNKNVKATDVSAAKDENTCKAQQSQNWHLKIHLQFLKICDYDAHKPLFNKLLRMKQARCNEAKQSLLLDTFPLQAKRVDFCWKLHHFVCIEWSLNSWEERRRQRRRSVQSILIFAMNIMKRKWEELDE